MRLQSLRIINCFGFADATIDLTPDLVYILGRNSSGKTALLDAINQLSPQRVPKNHARFANFKPTAEHPQLTGTLAVTDIPATDVTSLITNPLRGRGLADSVLSAHTQLQEGLKQLDTIYCDLFEQLATNGTLTLTKFSTGAIQLTVGNEYKEAAERRKHVESILQSTLPNGILTVASTNYQIDRLSASDLDRQAASIIPTIAYYNEHYALGDDLPDYLTTKNMAQPTNTITRAFINTINQDDATALLTTNDPDEQDRLRHALQERADHLATTISKQANRLLQITLTNTPNGIQITMRTDGKMSFYRLMSDATKLLFAYHLYALHHEPGAILLFDEPSRALHASATEYLRDLLANLSIENHVIITTHSEHLINLDRLDGIRLMQQDDQQRPTVLNKLKPPRNTAGFALALQPLFDAIGLAHAHRVLT
jgi:predicted ATP-dependent endonuclease of OLD family